MGAEADAVDSDFQDFKLLDLDLDWLQYDFFLLAGKFVGGDTFNFLGGERGRSLLDHSTEAGGDGFDFFRAQGDWFRFSRGVAFSIVGVGGETEADGAFVGLFRGGVELGQAGEVAGDERKDTGGHGVEGAEVADGAFVKNAARAVNAVVRGESGGLVDDEDGVHSEIERLSDFAIYNYRGAEAHLTPDA